MYQLNKVEGGIHMQFYYIAILATIERIAIVAMVLAFIASRG
jgi:hypothetical protein